MNVKEVMFVIPQVGFYKISANSWKHTPPFPHYNEKQRKDLKKEQGEMEEYTVWFNGCGIGGVNKIEDGYIIIKDHAERDLRRRKCEHESAIEKIDKALEVTKEIDWIQLFRKE